MAVLICEGACNPTLPTFDWFAVRYAEMLVSSGINEEILDHLQTQRQLLRHTEHLHLWRNRYACGVCGCERQYGPAEWAMERTA